MAQFRIINSIKFVYNYQHINVSINRGVFSDVAVMISKVRCYKKFEVQVEGIGL